MTVSSPLTTILPAPRLLDDYAPMPGVYDEMMEADGTVRPLWRKFVASLQAMPEDDRAKRWRLAERLLHENGLTYTADVASSERPWTLDFMPLLIHADEWRELERAVAQRAQLLNAILADLYGPQRLLRDGHLPPAAILGNPHFLRPCHGIQPRDGMWMHIYAADLGRGPDGRWRVLADRTQAPSGVGFALENRIVLSRAMPEMFRDLHVRRLASYFQSMHDSLVARTSRPNPRIVLLSPGPASEGYFAHAYIARYLGYTLTEGGDLTVRDSRLYLKSVDGLKPVDLVLRRIDSDDADPLELKVDSLLGVAGLVQAARTGEVTIANALGSGLVETKAMLAFLPRLCEELLGEELRLQSTPTWWCGDPQSRDHVLANLDHLAIDSAFRRRSILSRASSTMRGAALSARERAEIAEHIRVRGDEYVGQELVQISTTPTWLEDSLRPRPMTIRIFAAATRDEGFTVMPGGLIRVSTTSDSGTQALLRGDRTKDAWVLSDEPVSSNFTLLRSPLSYVKPKRTGKDLPSRAADNLFWLGRYAERAEDTMRVLRSVIRRMTEDAGPMHDVGAMQRLLRVLLEKSQPQAAQVSRTAAAGAVLEQQLLRLMLDPSRPFGLQESIGHLHRTASLARDRLSLDAWRTLSRFHSQAVAHAERSEMAPGALDLGDALAVLDDGIRLLAAFSGMEMENMTRNHGWRFLDMGRRLERAQHLVDTLRSLLTRGRPEEDGSLVLLLELADSIMTYRSRYLTTPMLPPVIDLLVMDETNPRSVGFQIAALAEHVDQLPRDADEDARTPEQRLVLSLHTEVRLADIAELCDEDSEGRRGALALLLDSVSTSLPHLSELITRSYFSHAEARRPVDL